MKILFCVLIVAATASISWADTMRVPGDFTTIQAAIDEAESRDTVLVYPGTYVENITFRGIDIVLASLFLTTGDTSYISQTVIDGGASGSVIRFHYEHNLNPTVLTGFTIKNGLNAEGGGIYCYLSNPTIAINQLFRMYLDARVSAGAVPESTASFRSRAL